MTTPNFKNSQLGITVSTDHPSFLVGSSGILFTDGSRQLTAFTGTALTNETDPIFTGSVSYNITSVQTGQWSQAYSWGDHSTLYATTGELSSVSGYLQSKIDAIPSDTNTFASSVTYNTGDRNLILNRNDGVSLTGNFDVVLHSGDNVSILVNDANYLVSGTNYHPNISAAISSDNNNNTFIQDILLDSNGHVTGITTAVATGTGGGGGQLTTEQVQDIVGNMVSSNVESGIAVTYNDAGDGTGKLNFIVASQTDENFTTADHSKLDGIEANADITDSGNVTAAGALMDSEVTNLSQVKAFDSSDYATAAQGTKADSAQQPPSEGAFADGDKTRLDTIETNADVTDTANVTSAGALMDSEVTNLSEVKAFASSDYATAAQGTKADSAQQPPSEGAFANGDKTRLDGIETSADVTDTANVTSAGALMDSEVTNLAQVKAFDSSDYLGSGSILGDLANVTTNNPINQNDILAYSSGGSTFVNTSLNISLIKRGSIPFGGYSDTQMGHYFYFDGSSEAVINTDGDDINFRVEGSGGTNLLFTDAGTDRVGIGTATPASTLDVSGTLTATTLIKSGGTSSQFLKADGSVDTSTYLTSVAFSNIAAAAIVTEGEGISSNDNDTTIPTSAAVKDYTDNNAGKTYTAGSGIVLSGGNSTVINVSDSTLLNTEIQAGSGINLIYDSGNGTLTINRTSENIGNLVTTETVGGRLTLEGGVPVSTSGLTAQTKLYFTPHISNNIALYNGSEWNGHTFNQLELSLSGYTADKNFDIFVHATGGTPVLESLVWTNDTTRATALTTQDGVYVKNGAATRRYLGTVRTTSSTGETEDSAERRFLWSYYNQVYKFQQASVAGLHTYTTNAWRAWNNNTTVGETRILFVLGLPQFVAANQCTHHRYQYGHWGLDSTNTLPPDSLSSHNGDTNFTSSTATHGMYIDAGYHFIQAMQYGLTTHGASNNVEVEAYLQC